MKVSIHYAVVMGSSTDGWHLARIIVDDDYGGLEISNVFIATFDSATEAVAFQRLTASHPMR